MKQKRESPPSSAPPPPPSADPLNSNKQSNNDIYNRAQKVRTDYEANLNKRYIVNKTDRYKNGLLGNTGARLPVFSPQAASPRDSPSSPTSSTGSLRTVAAPDIGPNSSGLPSRAPPPTPAGHQQVTTIGSKNTTTTTFHTYRQFKEQQKLAALQQRDSSLPPAFHQNGNGLPPAGSTKPDVVIKPYSERTQQGIIPRAGAPPEGSPPSPPAQYKSYMYKTASGAARTAIPTSSRSYNNIGTSSVYRGQQPSAPPYLREAERIQPAVPPDSTKG